MTNRTNRLAYDPGGLLSERSSARAAATPLELRDFLDEPAASRRRFQRFAEDANPENWRRANILPYETNTVTGESKWAVPGLLKGIFDSGVQAVTLPGRAMRGEVQLTDATGNVSQDAIAESLNFTDWALPVSAASRMGAKVTARSSQTRGLSEWRPNGTQAAMKEVEIDPPILPQRPFSDDYPNGAVADRAGKLLEDMEGRKLTAKFVAGRRFEGQPDVALNHGDIAQVAEGLMKRKHQLVPRNQMGGSLGMFDSEDMADGGWKFRIRVADDLHPRDVTRVLAHETGHLIDYLANTIPTRGLEHELGPLYDSLIKNKKSTGERWRPQDFRYSDEQAPFEYMAEALKTYETNPNTMKTMAPETAARIRSHVNDNPYLRNIIQFNGKILPYAAPVGVAYQQFAEPDDEKPVPTGRTFGRLYEVGR